MESYRYCPAVYVAQILGERHTFVCLSGLSFFSFFFVNFFFLLSYCDLCGWAISIKYESQGEAESLITGIRARFLFATAELLTKDG